jgi:hypothetical protein
MPWLPTATVVAVVVLIALLVLFLRVRAQDQLEDLIAKRKSSSRLVSRAQFVEGIERIPVALSLTTDTLNYENSDLQASLALDVIDEIEYDDETATGHAVVGKALRLRSHGHSFEFILDHATARVWSEQLPPRTIDQARAV